MAKNLINQAGTGNLAFADIHDSAFNIFLGKSTQYKELIDQLTVIEKLLSRTPECNVEERTEISQKIAQQKQLIDQFKIDVLQLAEQFSRAEINTERLYRAKELFESGEFGKAREVLENEVNKIEDEQRQLLVKRDEYANEIIPKLKNNAEQFFILGMLTQLDHSIPTWFVKACDYFERSIKSFAAKESVFYYAVFSWKHNKVAEAEKYYQMYLQDFASEISLIDRAAALNNLGLLHWDSNEFKKGLRECEEALEIYKKLSKSDPALHLSEVAGILNNMAMLRSELGESTKAREEYEEVLRVYRRLARKDPSQYQFEIATTLSNLGSMNCDGKRRKAGLKQLREALRILNELSNKRSLNYSFYVATAFHNLGRVYSAGKNYKKAVKAYEEALAIRMKAAATNPSVYLPEASCTLSSLAWLYARAIEDREKSIKYALETIKILAPIYLKVPFTQRYLEIALSVLKHWGVANEEIERLININQAS